MDGSHSRNTVPVETFLLPSAGGGSHCLSRKSCQNLEASVCQIASIEIMSQIMFGCPKIPRMSACHSRPVSAPLYGHTAIAQRQVPLRVGFCTKAISDQSFGNPAFLCVRYFRHILRFLLRNRRIGRHESQVGRCHLFIKIVLSIGSSGYCHQGIVHRNQLSLPVGMTA